MVCSSCQTKNLDDAQFCTKCGNALKRSCPSCSAENPLDARFCLRCGSRFAGAETVQTPIFLGVLGGGAELDDLCQQLLDGYPLRLRAYAAGAAEVER